MIESVEGRKEGYESDVDEGEQSFKSILLQQILLLISIPDIQYNWFLDIIIEFLNESVERDTSVSDEESSKDGDFSIPSYAR